MEIDLHVAFFLYGEVHFPELGYKVVNFDESGLNISSLLFSRMHQAISIEYRG